MPILMLLALLLASIVPLAAQDTSECEAGLRLFEDENIAEPICVPEQAQRIITLDPFYSLQMSLEMDLPVVGSGSYGGDGGFPEVLSEESLAGIEDVGTFETPNLETITALDPDLIIGDAYFLSDNYALFNEIAPTVLVNTADWKAWYYTIAGAAGVTERADAAFDAYNARIADLQALIPEDTTVSFLRVVPDGFQLYREAPNAYAPVAVMTEAGIIRPDFETGTDEESFVRFDYEGLGSIEGDKLLYVLGGADDEADQLEADTLNNPIWQLLPAVAAGQAYRVEANHWMSFGGLRSAHAVLDDLFTYVAGVDPQEASPNPFLANDDVEETANVCEEGYRLFDHELMMNDPTCIPEDPQRIVSLDMAGTEFLLYTDAPLVGTFAYVANEIAALTPGLGAKLEDVARLDWPPNLEVLTGLEPDLIVSFYDTSLDLAGVDQIAPLIIYDPSIYKGDWRPSTEFYSEIVQNQAAFEDMVATYDARVAELQQALGEERGDIEVSLLLPTTDNPMVWLQDSAPGHVLEDVGLGRPEFQIDPTIESSAAGQNWGYVNISLERLDLVDGDEIFIFTWASLDPEVISERQAALEDFQSSALWQALAGVQAGNVHVVGGQWVRAQTYLTVNLILDDLFTYLTDVEPTVPSPAAE